MQIIRICYFLLFGWALYFKGHSLFNCNFYGILNNNYNLLLVSNSIHITPISLQTDGVIIFVSVSQFKMYMTLGSKDIWIGVHIKLLVFLYKNFKFFNQT